MAKKTLHMETTVVHAEKIATEILAELSRRSFVKTVTTKLDNGAVIGVAFTIFARERIESYELTANEDGVFRVLQERRDYPWKYDKYDRAKARRVAWRQMFLWIQAQLAIVECGLANPDQVFMPWMIDKATGRTMYEGFVNWSQKQLPAANEASA